jgi:hypothetical protein
MHSLIGFKGLIWAQPLADTITLGIGLVFLTIIFKKALLKKTIPMIFLISI